VDFILALAPPERQRTCTIP